MPRLLWILVYFLLLHEPMMLLLLRMVTTYSSLLTVALLFTLWLIAACLSVVPLLLSLFMLLLHCCPIPEAITKCFCCYTFDILDCELRLGKWDKYKWLLLLYYLGLWSCDRYSSPEGTNWGIWMCCVMVLWSWGMRLIECLLFPLMIITWIHSFLHSNCSPIQAGREKGREATRGTGRSV